MIAMLAAGAAVGIGLSMLVAGARPAVPDLAGGVARLTGAWSSQPAVDGGRLARAGQRVGARLADAFRLERHASDLAIVGSTTGRLAMHKLGYAAVGLAFPATMTAILAMAGVALPFALPAALGLGLAAAMSFLPEVELRRRARAAREQMRRTVCVYLELVALERAADAGAVESLERAAAIGGGPGFEHVREALLRARLEGRTPWQQLADLSESLAVPELGDVADIMRLSGEDGAAVLPTLRARAASLRTSLLQADVTAANEASERMSIPVALLGVAFMALLGFPAFWRILFG